MRQPIVTLTTDFGLAGHFAAAMKGVILRIEPRARIVDISHEITPYAISEAGFAVAQVYRYFPKGTIHVAVVDPGVGTSRRPLLVEAAGQYFVAPDNALLSMVYSREKHKVRAVTASKFFLKPVSGTFHGRDVFAPVAAHLARGVRPPQFGNLISDYVRSWFSEPVQTGKGTWRGAVLAVDSFGNLITNFPVAQFPELTLTAGKREVTRRVDSYAEGAPGELIVIAGSSGYYEIACNQSSAAQRTGCAAGAEVKLSTTRRTVPARGSGAR
jgi:S-adenosyl-L-methionine hydrolase (adenosine-forming)